MKLRYYLRGLGIGLLVCGAVSLAAGENSKGMTDAQIRARARELGMIENPVLTDIATGESTVEASSIDMEPETVTDTGSVDATTEMESEQETTTAEADGDSNATVTIVIHSGDGSGTVSQRLFEAGLITDAGEYDRYLMENGYDRKLTPGNHEIPVDATEEEMAKALCKSAR